MELTVVQKESLKLHLTGAVEIYEIVKDNYIIAKRFSQPKNEMEFEYQNYDIHFRTITFALWRILIVDIAKLIIKSGSNHYNIIQLIEDFKVGSKFHNEKITESDITGWLEKLDKFKIPTENIKLFRDKAYAHSDKDREQKTRNKPIGVNEFGEIINIIGSIFQQIYLVIFNIEFSLETKMEKAPFLIKERLVFSREREEKDPEYKKLIFNE